MDLSRDGGEQEALPLFSVRTSEKKSGQTLYINFKSSETIKEPDEDINEDELVQEICNPSPRIEKFKIPLRISQIFWTKPDESDAKRDRRDYVVDVEMNYHFAVRRVIPSEIIRHYVVTVTMTSIEEKFNLANSSRVTRQYVGHKLELDQAGYEILDARQQIARSSELVNNKVLLVERPAFGDASKEIVPDDDKTSSSDLRETSYDLYLRPKSSILTCSIETDRCPDSFSFNDDRICVEQGDKTLVDVHLPLQIDLSQPVKYKFDDKQGLFRIVFKLEDND